MRNIILHHSASKFGNSAIITEWHLDRGWRTIGYHFVILNGKITATCEIKEFDGHIETGRGLNETGAHTKGYNENIGICLIGDSGRYSSKQIESCHELIKLIKRIDDIKEVKQHSDFDPVNKPYCAGFNEDMMEMFNERLD